LHIRVVDDLTADLNVAESGKDGDMLHFAIFDLPHKTVHVMSEIYVIALKNIPYCYYCSKVNAPYNSIFLLRIRPHTIDEKSSELKVTLFQV